VFSEGKVTLIIGIRCEDGIVLGGDGASTVGSLSGTTIKQPTKKLEIIDGKVILGFSGPVGLGQILKSEIVKVWGVEKNVTRSEATDLRVAITKKTRPHVEREFNAAAGFAKVLGQNELSSALCTVLLALPLYSVSKDFSLIEFTHQCSSEEVTSLIPFSAIGSGKNIADPFLAFIKKIFWKDRIPTLAEGRFAVIWTLIHTIETNPGGVDLSLSYE
jgi:hypothetical protein